MMGFSHISNSASIALVASTFILPTSHNKETWIVFFVAFAVAARLPDQLEFPIRKFGKDTIYPFGHRTWTHWWPFWVGALWATLHFLPWVWWSAAITGVIASSIGHLVMDAMTHGGIPVLYPTGCPQGRGKRGLPGCFSMHFMKTGGIAEYSFSWFVFLSSVSWFAWNGFHKNWFY